MLKSIGHSTMALGQVGAPYLDNPADQSWRSPMTAAPRQSVHRQRMLEPSSSPSAKPVRIFRKLILVDDSAPYVGMRRRRKLLSIE
jgi:hypothetical protein